ncbi:MarR family transcriptional regulator [Alphaproteobacteria bacterium HT1-32]|nr:MarR family transcriptional regulator [Alphaproteobacteria bacterium HT1-32]
MGRKCTDSDSGQAELRLEEFLPYRLSILAGRVSVSFAGIYKQRFGISIPQWRVLANLGQFAPLSAAELARHSSMDKVQISRTISKMARAGLITRQTDPDDNRALILSLSDRGQALLAQIIPLALAWEAELLSDLDEQEIALLDNLLNRLGNKVDRLSATAD